MSTSILNLIEKWNEFGLAELQAELDSVASEVACRQDLCELSRKTLVELTREFRRDTPDEIRKVVIPVLKSYQSEVDRLSDRSKTAETAFLNVYKKMIDFPDMSSMLEYSVNAQQKLSKLTDLEIENKQLRETLNDYNDELRDIRNQDLIVQHLKEELRKHEGDQRETIEGRVKELERQMLREFQDREQTYRDEQLLLSRKLNEAEMKVAQLTSGLDLSQTELLEIKAKYEDRSHARSDELDMVMEDLERATQRAALAEREVHTLKEQLVASSHKHSSDSPVGDDGFRRSTDLELAAKEKEISQLVEDVQRLQNQLSHLESQSLTQRVQLEEQLEQKNKIIYRLEIVMDQQKDYDEVKKELSIMKSIEFPGTSQSSIDASSPSSGKPLEVLMLEKNRSLQNENTALKVSVADIQARFDRLEEHRERLLEDLQQKQDLVEKLENDLGDVNTISAGCRVDGEGETCSSEWVAEAVRDTMSSASSQQRESAPTPDPGSAAESLLPIVSAQRERFRMRIQELEQLLYRQQQEMSLKDSDVEDLRRDNLKLFEKIKYLQSYSAQKSNSQDVESRYSRQYEDGLDPFNSFSRRERGRKYAQLSPFEKITLSMGQMVLSNKLARSAAFLYTLLLHLLVFAVLYKLAYTEIHERDVSSDCAARYAEHMLEVHGSKSSSDVHGMNHQVHAAAVGDDVIPAPPA